MRGPMSPREGGAARDGGRHVALFTRGSGCGGETGMAGRGWPRGASEALSSAGFACQLAWGYMACLSPALMPPESAEQGVGIEYAYYVSQVTILVAGIAAVLALRRWHPGVPPWAVGAAGVALTLASAAVASLVSRGLPGAAAMAGLVACGVVYGLAGALAGVAWGARATLAGGRAAGFVLASFGLAFAIYLVLGWAAPTVQRAATLALPLVSAAAWTYDSWRRHGLTSDVWPTRAQVPGSVDELGEASAGEVAASMLPWSWLALVAAAAFAGNLASSFVMGESYAGAATIYPVGVAVALALVAASAAAGVMAGVGRGGRPGLPGSGRAGRGGDLDPMGVLFGSAAALAALGMLLAMLDHGGVPAPGPAAVEPRLLGVAVVVGAGIAFQVVTYLVTVDATRRAGVSPLLSFGVGQAVVAGVVVAGNLCGRALSRALAGTSGPLGGTPWLSVVCAAGVFFLFCLMAVAGLSPRGSARATGREAGGDGASGEAGATPREAGGPGGSGGAGGEVARAAWEDRVRAMSGELGLTPREAQVLEWLLRGHTMASIGERLYVTTGTVKTHVLHIYRKAGVGGRQELIERFEGMRAQADEAPADENSPAR